MDITFNGFGITSTLYWAPTISVNGWLSVWKGRHSGWRKGFVARFFWLGFLLRWDKIKKARPAFRFSQLERMIQEANDGDYGIFDENPH